MKLILATTVALFLFFNSLAQNEKFKVSENLEIIQLSPTAFIHVSYFSDPKWGRIASNGLVLVENNEAFLFDTPMDEPTTIELVKFIEDSLRATVTGFVPNHWHNDCIGGLAYLHKIGVNSYAHKMTSELAGKNGYSVPEHTFTDSMQLQLGEQKIFCYFPGAAHSLDNIVVWIPNEQILFGGCMVKEMKSNSMGNYVDGDLKAWPCTIRKVMGKFPSARIVIPGHGQYGGFDLLKHTLDLAEKNAR